MRNDRWATPEEIKTVLCADKNPKTALDNVEQKNTATGGPILFHKNNRLYHYACEGHTLYLGTSGSGKSRRGTIPLIRSLIKAGEVCIVADPKGEVYRATAPYAKAADYEVILINFRRIFESARFNPLAAPYELFKSGDPLQRQVSMELIDELAYALFPAHEKADPFWAESARSLFIAIVFALYEYAEKDQINMASVYQMVVKGERRYATNTYLKSFVENLPDDSVSSMLLQSYVNTASDTKSGIRSTFLEGLSLFTRSEGMIEMLSGDDLHINSLDGNKRIAIYIVTPDETPIFDKISGILCNQLMSHYIRLAEDKYHGRLPLRHNFVIEELGNIGASLKNLPHMLSAGRSRNVRVQYVLQSLSQLNNIYSSSEATTIISNTDVVVAYRTNNWETLTELSRICGEREVVRGNHITREPLITPSQLGAMKTGQALVSVAGALRFITWLPDYEEMFDCSAWIAPKQHVRKIRTKPDIFNIVDYVSEMRKKKFLEDSNSPPVFTPSIPSSMDDLMREIDAQIQKLEQEETDKKQETPRQEDKYAPREKAIAKYELLVVNTGGSNEPWVAKAISNTCKISIVETLRRLDSLPATFRFKTKEEAEAAEKAVTAAGGVAFVKDLQ